MEIYLEALQRLLIPEVIAGLLGGVIGASTIRVELYGWRFSVLYFIGAIISAGSFAEYITHTFGYRFILLHCIGGFIVAVVSTSLLDAIAITAPRFTKKLVDLVANGILEVVKELPSLAIKKLEELIGWIRLFLKKDNDNE